MPVYVYEVVRDDAPDGLPGQRFEVVQSITEPAIATHPVTGQPVRRVVQPIALAGMHSDLKTAGKLDEKNLARHGFAKYIKVGDETYEKMVGDGPSRLSAQGLQNPGG
ncbi:MAG: FmdB family transcriptional regulator [Phycisphaerales bacterium JB063]